MSVRDRVFQVAEKLLETKQFDQITFAEIADSADVHWTTVRRYFGNKENMRVWLKEKQTNMKEGRSIPF